MSDSRLLEVRGLKKYFPIEAVYCAALSDRFAPSTMSALASAEGGRWVGRRIRIG